MVLFDRQIKCKKINSTYPPDAFVKKYINDNVEYNKTQSEIN